jgi:hypothetical protein
VISDPSKGRFIVSPVAADEDLTIAISLFAPFSLLVSL